MKIDIMTYRISSNRSPFKYTPNLTSKVYLFMCSYDLNLSELILIGMMAAVVPV